MTSKTSGERAIKGTAPRSAPPPPTGNRKPPGPQPVVLRKDYKPST